MSVHAGKPGCRFEFRPWRGGKGTAQGDVPGAAAALTVQWALANEDAVEVPSRQLDLILSDVVLRHQYCYL